MLEDVTQRAVMLVNRWPFQGMILSRDDKQAPLQKAMDLQRTEAMVVVCVDTKRQSHVL